MAGSFVKVGFADGSVVLLGPPNFLVETGPLFGVAFDAKNAAKDVVGGIECEQGGRDQGDGQPIAEFEVGVGPEPEGEEEEEGKEDGLPPFHILSYQMQPHHTEA
jgi:hypothetical protein